MNSCVVKLCIFLFLAEGTLGAEITINVRTSASVTLVCSTNEDLTKCYCSSFSKHCCTDRTVLVFPSTTNNSEKYFELSGLKHSNSGLYACYNQKIGQKYTLNVLEDQNQTLVIGTVGQSIVLSSSNKLDIMAASEKHWCRLDTADVCQPNTVMGPENGPRGDFQILDADSSFSLEKRNVTHNDTGSYRLTLIFPSQTKVYVVKLQVKDKDNNLQIIHVPDNPKLEITCEYSQELQHFSKSWLCDNSECPDTVRSVEDRFKSSLVLTLDHAPCSKIKQFMCVAKTSGSHENSNVYFKPYKPNRISLVKDLPHIRNRRLNINMYSLLKLSCWHDNYYFKPFWCRVSGYHCTSVTENIIENYDKTILEMCVTPNDNNKTYRCTSSMGTSDVTLAVVEPSSDSLYFRPWRPAPPDGGLRNQGHNTGILIVVICIVLIISIVLVTATKCNSQKLKRLFERRTPLAAVDIHANMYANAIAQYYNQQCDVPPPDKQGGGDNKEISSSSDDAFEELPVRQKRSSMKKETDYVRVKPGGATRSLNANALLKDSNVYGLGRKGEVGYTSKTKTDKLVKKQGEVGAQSSSGRRDNKDDDDDYEVNYTRVTIKPKH